MQKTYELSDILTHAQLQDLTTLAKKQIKNPAYYCLYLTPLWKMHAEEDCLQLELLQSPIPKSKIVMNIAVLPSIKKIKMSNNDSMSKKHIGNLDRQRRDAKCYRVSKKDAYLIKIVDFINCFILKGNFNTENQIQLDLGVLGYFRSRKFQADYFNSKGLLKWSLINCPSRPKLDEIINMQPKQKNAKNSRNQILSCDNTQMERKFSLNSFKQYSVQKKFNNNSRPSSRKMRTKSLPSISPEEAKANHKLVLKKVEAIMQNEQKLKISTNKNHLKIQQRPRKHQKYQSRLNSTKKQDSLSCSESTSKISYDPPFESSNILKWTKSLKFTQGQKDGNELKISLINIQNEQKQAKINKNGQNQIGSMIVNGQTEYEIASLIHNINQKTAKSIQNSENIRSNKSELDKESQLVNSKCQQKQQQQKQIAPSRPLTPPKQTVSQKISSVPAKQQKKKISLYHQQPSTKEETKCRPHISFKSTLQSDDSSHFQKQIIQRLLSSNPLLANNKKLIDELHEIYSQSSSYMLLSQVFAPTLHKKQGSNRRRKYLPVNFKPRTLVYHQAIETCIAEKHRTDTFMISLMNKITVLTDELQSIKFYDFSSEVLKQKVDTLYSMFQNQLSQIQWQIQSYIKEQMQKQKQKLLIQQKFHMFKFGHASKNKKVAKIESQENELMVDIENQFAPDSEKNLKRIFNLFSQEKKQVYYKYYLENYYMSYFYIFSQGISQAIINIFSGVNKRKGVIFIELKKIKDLPQTLSDYMQKIEAIHQKLLSLFNKIPNRTFHLQQFQRVKIKEVLNRTKSDIKKCEQDWQRSIQQKYEPFKLYLIQCKTVEIKFKEKAKQNPTQPYLKQRQQHLRLLTGKLERLSKVTTYLKSGDNILDTNAAKMHLMQKYERCISNFYQSALHVMSQISLAWSQQMVRTERLLADQLAEQEHEIGAKIKFLAKDYYSLTKFVLLERKFYYLSSDNNNNNDDINCDQILQCRKLSSIVPKDNKMSETRKLTQSKPQQINPMQAFNEVFVKCLSYSYNMSKKNRQKVQQISYLVQRHKQKMLFLAKSLQAKEKQVKVQSIYLTSQLKKIIKQVKCKTDLPRMQPRIKAVQVRYKAYQKIVTKLHQQMAKNMMITWEDDDFLQNNINVCIRTINFIQSDIYIRINFHTIDTLRFQHFFKYYKLLEKLMIVIEGHKFEQLFQAQYDLTKKQFELIEMVLYKDYTVSEIQQIYNTCAIDLRPTLTTLKIHDFLKLYRSKLSNFKDISKVYYRRKKQKYDRNLHKQQRIQIELSEYREDEIAKIINYDQILITFDQSQDLTAIQKQSNIKSIQIVNKLMEIYDTIRQYQIMLKQIDEDIKQEDHVSIVMYMEKIKMYYHNALNTFKAQKNFSIENNSEPGIICFRQKEWQKLLTAVNELEFNVKLKQKFYTYLSQLCSRLIMIPYRSLIQLMDWSTQANILRNIKIMFEQVVDVEFGTGNSIVALYVTRGKRNDRIVLSCGPIATDKVHKYGKLVRHIQKQVQKSLLLMIRNSNGRAGQIKLLYWLLYFTEQVEQSIKTNSSLKILQMHLSQTICSIKCDLRYDMQNHKDQQIAQINTFIHYINDYLGAFPEIEGWTWLNTIRAYEKNNCVMIQQNNLEFYYGFEPKSVRIIENMNWNLGISVSYGDSTLKQMYKYKAYILGAPYFQIHEFSDCFLAEERNLSKLLGSLQSNSLICSIFQPVDPRYTMIFNEIHKQIMNYYFNKLRNCKYQQQERAYSEQSEHSLEYHDADQLKTKSKKEVIIKQSTNPESACPNQSHESNQKVDSGRGISKSKKKVVAIAGDSLNKSKANRSDNSGKDNTLTAIRSKISIHMCYHSYPEIPRCFLSMYRCTRAPQVSSEILTLRIHLLVQFSSISSQLKWKLIWKLIKLARCLNQLRSSTLQELMAIIQKILGIIEQANGVTKQVKNQIYCYIVQHFMADYEKASLIANQVFKVEDFINQWAIQNPQKSAPKIQQSSQELDISQSCVSILTRSSLLDKLKAQYSEMMSTSLANNKPIVIYGDQPTCKTTFITEHLKLKLNISGGYIQSSFMNYLQSSQSSTGSSISSYSDTPFTVIEAGSIHELSPAAVLNCFLMYVPAIPIQGNEQYEDQLRTYFETTLLNCETMAVQNRGVLVKMWTIAKILYSAYQMIETNNRQNLIKFNAYIEMVLKIFTQFISKSRTQYKQSMPKLTNQNSKCESGDDNKQKQQLYLLYLICYQHLCASLSSKHLRKQMVELLRSMKTSGKIKFDFKLQEVQTLTYTCTGEIVKADSAFSLSKSNNTANSCIIRKETLFINNLIHRQLNIIKRYIELKVNVCASGNSSYLMREIQGTLRALCEDTSSRGNLDDKVQHGQSNNKCFIVQANMKSIMRIYDQLPLIYSRKKMRLNLSKAMISGKIMELSSRAHIQHSAAYNPGFIGSDHIMQDDREYTIILVQDLHMGDINSVANLAAILNRTANPDFCNYNDTFGQQISQVFVIFKNKNANYNDACRSQRLRRFIAEVTLPDLQLQSIYKYRSHFMMNQEQAGIALQLFNIGLMGDYSNQLLDQNERKQIDDTKVRFAIQTNIRMPSQFYTKFIMHRLIMQSISAASVNLPFTNYQPAQTVANLLTKMQQKQSMSNIVQRLQKYSSDNLHQPLSYKISEKDGKWVQIDAKKIQAQLQPFISSLTFVHQLLANNLMQLLPLLSDSQLYILQSTPMISTAQGPTPLLTTMLCRSLKHKQITLTHNYLSQITAELSVLQTNPSQPTKTCFIIPQYLLHYQQFVSLLQSIIQIKNGSQLLVTHQGMFQYWWQLVAEYQFIHNKQHQYQFIKQNIQDSINRIIFYIVLDDMTISSALQILTYTPAHKQHYVIQSVQQQNTKNISTWTSLIQSNNSSSPNLQNNNNLTNHHQTYTDNHHLLQYINPINCRLSKDQQIQLMNQAAQHYMAVQQYSESSVGKQYAQTVLNYLIYVLQYQYQQQNSYQQQQKSEYSSSIDQIEQANQRRRKSKQITAKYKKSYEKYLLYQVLQLMPKLFTAIQQITLPKCLAMSSKSMLAGTMYSIYDQDKLTTLDLIHNLSAKVTQANQHQAQLKTKLHYYGQYYAKLAQQLKDQPSRQSKCDRYNLSVGSHQSQLTNLQKFHCFNTQLKQHPNFEQLKQNYLSHAATETKIKQINFNKNQRLLQKIYACFGQHKNDHQLYQHLPKHEHDFVIESKQEIQRPILQSDQNGIRNYVQCQAGFVRLCKLDAKFIQYLRSFNQEDFASIIANLQCIEPLVNNYKQFVLSVEYSYAIIQLMSDPSECSLLLSQLEQVEHTSRLDALTICSNAIQGIEIAFGIITDIEAALKKCITFLLQIGNYKQSSLPQQPSQELSPKIVTYQRNHDIQVKLELFQIISMQLLSKIKNNCHLYYKLHQLFQLQSVNNILYTLDHPKILQSYKWQQIQHLIFMPLLASTITQPQSSNTNTNGNENMKRSHKLSIFGQNRNEQRSSIFQQPRHQTLIVQKQANNTPQANTCLNISNKFNQQPLLMQVPVRKSKQTSKVGLSLSYTKYAIVYDPYSQLLKYIQSGGASASASYRKIVHIKNQSQGKTKDTVENNQKLDKVNHVLTFYIYYFRQSLENLQQNNYNENISCLNRVLSILNKKDQRGLGQNDRLIILVHHQFLCQDLKRKREFGLSSTSTSIKNVITVSLISSELDLIESFAKPSANKQDKVMTKHMAQNLKQKAAQKQKILQKNTSATSQSFTQSFTSQKQSLQPRTIKNLQTLHSQCNMSKSYLKMLIKNMIDQMGEIFNKQNRTDLHQQLTQRSNIAGVMKSLQDFENRKCQLLNQYCEQKLINYEYYLDDRNLQAIKKINNTIWRLVEEFKINVDFVEEISEYTTIQQLIEQLLVDSKSIQNKQIMKENKNKSFYQERARSPTRKLKSVKSGQELQKILRRLYEQYKTSLITSLYCVKSSLTPGTAYQSRYLEPTSGEPINRNKILVSLANTHQIFVLVYDQFQTWTVEQLLQNHQRNKIKLLFDPEPACFQMLIQLVTLGNKNGIKIVFIVHISKLETVKEMLHSVKIFWI